MGVEASVLWDIVEEHLDEAAFLLQSWLAAARSPRTSLAALQKTIESRLIAHLDGLAVAGTVVSDRLLWPALADKSKARASVVASAGAALLLDPDAATCDRVVEALRTTGRPAVRAGLIQAFEITSRADVDEPLKIRGLDPLSRRHSPMSRAEGRTRSLIQGSLSVWTISRGAPRF
jgi:hypothetical protein